MFSVLVMTREESPRVVGEVDGFDSMAQATVYRDSQQATNPGLRFVVTGQFVQSMVSGLAPRPSHIC